MKFNKRLQSLVDEIATLDWFCNCGSELNCGDISRVKDWNEAKRYYSTKKWEKMIIAVSNRRGDILWEQGLRETELNKLGDEVLSCVCFILKTFPVFKSAPVDDLLKWKVELDLRIICSEINALYLVHPLFGIPHVWDWYRVGRLPCGWDGAMIREDWEGNGPDDLPSGCVRVL